jgi:MFS family permease
VGVLRRRLAASRAAMRDVLVQPQLRRAETAFALAWTSEAAFTVSLGVVAFRDGGATAVGLVALLRMLPSAILSPLLVAVADRVRREHVLAAVSGLHAVALGGAAAMVHAGAPPAVVYALAIVSTVAFTVFRPAHSALLPSLCTTTREVTSANVVRGLLDSAGTLVGPALAGVLLALGDPTWVLAASAGLSLAAAVVLLRIRYESPPVAVPDHRRSLVRDTVDGLQAVVGHPDLRLVFGLGFAQTFVRGALNVFTVVVAFELLDSGEAGVATLSGAVGAGGILGVLGVSLLVGSRHLGAWLAVALVGWGAPIALLGAQPRQAAAVVLLAVVGMANAIIDVPLFTLPVRLAPDAVLARVFGVFESLVALGVGLGSVATPALVAVLGVRGALVALGLLLPLLAVLTWHRLRQLDLRLAIRDDEIDVLRGVPMLGQLPVPSIEHLASRLRRVEVPAGEVLLAQGASGGGFYVILEGEAEVIGDGELVATIGAGDSFGEIALLQGVPRTATIRALTPLTVFELDPEDFLDAVAGFRVSRDAASAVVARHLASFRPAGIGI